jgi:superfamily I DNA/RNA helicase
MSVLAQQAVFDATGRTPRPLLSYEQQQMVNDLSRSFGGTRQTRALLKAYEAAWARLQADEPGMPRDQVDQDFEVALVDWLRFHRAILIGELVPLTLTYIRQNPAEAVVPRFEAVVVDEFQDLNRADQELVIELSRHGSIAVVGDDNQSIYRFRNANPMGIQVFPDQNPGTVCYVIEECRRCPPNIVNMSNSLISNNPRRIRDVAVVPDTSIAPATVYIVQHHDVLDEIDAICGYVDQYLTQNPELPPGQVLVLATRRFIGHGIRRALIGRGLNALSYFYEDELDSPSAAEGFCLLNLLTIPDDRAALRAWIGLGPSNNGFSAGYARIRDYAQDHGLEVREVLRLSRAGDLQVPYTQGIIDRYGVLEERLQEINGRSGIDLVHALWPQEDEDTQDIRVLAQNLAVDNPEPAEMHAALVREITQPELPSSGGDIIRVMSLHKSKGLGASLVVVAGCVSGALPTINRRESQAVQDATEYEQRRLFYVAITRTIDTLVVSSFTRMQVRDAYASGIDVLRTHIGIARTAPSPFIAELGRDAPRPINTEQWRQQAGF